MKTVFYLSKNGDSFELVIFTEVEIKKLTQNDNIHPILKKYLGAHTHGLILSMLKEIQGSIECQQHVELYHKHNPDIHEHSINVGFGMQKGAAHKALRYGSCVLLPLSVVT